MWSSYILASLLSLTLLHGFVVADIGSAISGVANLLAGYLGDVLIFVLVIAGYLYMTSIGDAQNGVHAKRAIGAAVAGGILVAVAVNFGPTLARLFQK
ncbi:hypothetical protein [Dictyobacter kobayashii]|uniref:Uncharacterized protein n=1 Tax=Dictyobacter kobayashii TaxID=2014872 RepID=A0A402AW30_9CHLR|nr:hypothetical protein [Dictyobacter kobayashii]GCE23233.1 hypothetical protein KDK_70330 [Dictyobacter kobayashii]